MRTPDVQTLPKCEPTEIIKVRVPAKRWKWKGLQQHCSTQSHVPIARPQQPGTIRQPVLYIPLVFVCKGPGNKTSQKTITIPNPSLEISRSKAQDKRKINAITQNTFLNENRESSYIIKG